MPIYEYECELGHRTEEIYFHFDPPKVLVCQHTEGLEQYGDVACCGMDAKLQISAPTMRPDKHWHGTMVRGQMVHSSKEYNEMTKNYEPASDATRDYAVKRREEKKKEIAVKKEKRIEKWMAKELANA